MAFQLFSRDSTAHSWNCASTCQIAHDFSTIALQVFLPMTLGRNFFDASTLCRDSFIFIQLACFFIAYLRTFFVIFTTVHAVPVYLHCILHSLLCAFYRQLAVWHRMTRVTQIQAVIMSLHQRDCTLILSVPPACSSLWHFVYVSVTRRPISEAAVVL